MKKPVSTAFILATAVVLITGCEQTDTKKNRLAAFTENMRLNEQLEQCNKTLELRDQEIKKQKGQLDNYLQQIQSLQIQAHENIQNQVTGVLSGVMAEIAKLQQENESLEAQIEQLKK